MAKTIINLNNWRSRRKKHRFDPDQLLILLPSCLQASKCQVNLRGDITNCKRCGSCNVSDIVNLAEEQERVRVLRQRAHEARREDRPVAETMEAAFVGLRDQGMLPDEARSLVAGLSVVPVFTAASTPGVEARAFQVTPPMS